MKCPHCAKEMSDQIIVEQMITIINGSKLDEKVKMSDDDFIKTQCDLLVSRYGDETLFQLGGAIEYVCHFKKGKYKSFFAFFNNWMKNNHQPSQNNVQSDSIHQETRPTLTKEQLYGEAK